MAINAPKSSGGGLEKLMSLASIAGGIMTGNPMLIAGGTKSIADQNKAANTPTNVETSNEIVDYWKRRQGIPSAGVEA